MGRSAARADLLEAGRGLAQHLRGGKSEYVWPRWRRLAITKDDHRRGRAFDHKIGVIANAGFVQFNVALGVDAAGLERRPQRILAPSLVPQIIDLAGGEQPGQRGGDKGDPPEFVAGDRMIECLQGADFQLEIAVLGAWMGRFLRQQLDARRQAVGKNGGVKGDVVSKVGWKRAGEVKGHPVRADAPGRAGDRDAVPALLARNVQIAGAVDDGHQDPVSAAGVNFFDNLNQVLIIFIHLTALVNHPDDKKPNGGARLQSVEPRSDQWDEHFAGG